MSAPAPAPVAKTKKKKLGGILPWDISGPHPAITISTKEIPADGSSPDAFKVLLTRQEKREKRTESRREAKERKAERLRDS